MMDQASAAPQENPNKRKKADSSTDTQDLETADIQVSVLESINKKLDVLSLLHQEIKDLKASLEFTHQQIADLQLDNTELRSALTAVTSEPGIIQTLVLALNQRPWLLGVYVIAVGLPVILFISFMWPDKRFGPPDQPYYYKKSDDAQPDDPEMLRLNKSTKITGPASRQDALPAHKRKHKQTAQ